jgi:hypothetical protein
MSLRTLRTSREKIFADVVSADQRGKRAFRVQEIFGSCRRKAKDRIILCGLCVLCGLKILRRLKQPPKNFKNREKVNNFKKNDKPS